MLALTYQNYYALKELGKAGDSFNDVITHLLEIAERQQQEAQQQNE